MFFFFDTIQLSQGVSARGFPTAVYLLKISGFYGGNPTGIRFGGFVFALRHSVVFLYGISLLRNNKIPDRNIRE